MYEPFKEMIAIQPCSQDGECLDGAILRYVANLQKEKFFGIAELHFQNGEIVRIKKQEVVLPKDLLRVYAE